MWITQGDTQKLIQIYLAWEAFWYTELYLKKSTETSKKKSFNSTHGLETMTMQTKSPKNDKVYNKTWKLSCR